ncbi:F-box protein SKIP16 [Dichanthelium oligosanthes]|uniref:F-box protein SKIP16 n=1 Tax=Dichanthelium oligosanthes TaxID=888268 RepID=A0A1E5W6S7_9POAL|nr:F-box protein SKIP16 [Dichanthelium oligosanthes]
MTSPPPPPDDPTAAAAAGLESMEGLVLDTVISKAGPRPAAALACASTRLRAAVADDSLWRRFCAEDLGLDAPVDPEGRPLPSFQVAYKVWLESFGMYPLPLVKRVKEFWNSMKSWLSENFPEAAKTLCKGVSEAQLKSAEEDLGFKLPMPTKLLYRFCNAQLPFSENDEANKSISTHGIIGGYAFYDHWVNVHLSPIEQIIEETKEFYREFPDVFNGSNLIILATSWFHPKTFLLNCSNGELYVGTNNLPLGEMLPCVPKALIKRTDNDLSQDGLLLWLEEHLRRLQNGMIKTRMLMTSRLSSVSVEYRLLIFFFICSNFETAEVRASAVFVPEHPHTEGSQRTSMYTYSIRMSVPEACMLGGVYYSSCQLHSRHWTIRSRDRVISDVNGEGVIGEYPVLSSGRDEFVYESCTPLPKGPGSVEGSFTFVPGKLSRPEGRPFKVTVAPFHLEEPEYIF